MAKENRLCAAGSFYYRRLFKRNIAFGEIDERINNQELSKAIELAGLKDFVQNLENKENTIIGERGSRLSGGQRQRIELQEHFITDQR